MTRCADLVRHSRGWVDWLADLCQTSDNVQYIRFPIQPKAYFGKSPGVTFLLCLILEIPETTMEIQLHGLLPRFISCWWSMPTWQSCREPGNTLQHSSLPPLQLLFLPASPKPLQVQSRGEDHCTCRVALNYLADNLMCPWSICGAEYVLTYPWGIWMDWPAVMYAEVGFMKRRGLVGTLD